MISEKVRVWVVVNYFCVTDHWTNNKAIQAGVDLNITNILNEEVLCLYGKQDPKEDSALQF